MREKGSQEFINKVYKQKLSSTLSYYVLMLASVQIETPIRSKHSSQRRAIIRRTQLKVNTILEVVSHVMKKKHKSGIIPQLLTSLSNIISVSIHDISHISHRSLRVNERFVPLTTSCPSRAPHLQAIETLTLIQEAQFGGLCMHHIWHVLPIINS